MIRIHIPGGPTKWPLNKLCSNVASRACFVRYTFKTWITTQRNV